ncbi:Utp30p Ecym_5195 [Eremothecium cymbalariae DBVPG|uniref:Ribosomal protein L1 n=1 Tax=Eremothecium cymbalariae (strain CBS 270.75 / DBVPG 7215 / KCTC 17166 / NRRL Y-17582) TaxID=931890 RepID=I6ND24_ERECY|nr:hypothetical protein Ecym_5195 [Eremothecium cymbalariae DBVPG\
MSIQLDRIRTAEALHTILKQCGSDPQLVRDSHIHLVITTSKPIGIKNDHIPRIIPLNHCKLSKPSDMRILLVVKDPSTFYRNSLKADESTAEMFADIISVKNLKTKYKGSKLNKLFKDYDMVMADYCVHHLLPHILGSAFYKSNRKIPFMLQMSRQVKKPRTKMVQECDTKYIRAQVRSICKNTWYVPNPDNCLTVRIGNVGVHKPDEMTYNIQDIINFLCDKSKRPQGGCIRGGIDSLFIKTSNSTSLPIYKRAKSTTDMDIVPKL